MADSARPQRGQVAGQSLMRGGLTLRVGGAGVLEGRSFRSRTFTVTYLGVPHDEHVPRGVSSTLWFVP
jgi:hypothetical protein